MLPGKRWTFQLKLLLGLSILVLPARLDAQVVVDCSGNTAGAYSTIGAALLNAGNGANILVMPGAPCNENVTISGMSNLSIGTDWLEHAVINGSLNIDASHNVFLYGFDVTSPNSDGNHPNGILVTNSTNVSVNACLSHSNQANGLRVDGHSSVVVGDHGAFNNNGNSGVSVTGHSYLQFVAWGGEIDIMFNRNSGLYIDRSDVVNLGHIAINDNLAAPTATLQSPSGFGIDMRGMSTAIMFALFGTLEISGNQGGGISLIENSQLSIGGNQTWAPNSVLIATNSSTGISAGFGSQLTVFGGTRIVEHATVGIDLYGKSQAAVYGDNVITRIGSGMEPAKAAIRVDGNSEAYLRGGLITQNVAPGVLALVNSSVDAAGAGFASNAGPNFVCDGSAFITGDMPPSSLGAANSCRIPGSAGVVHRFQAPTGPPDWHAHKAAADRFRAFSSRFRH